jgi:hypothetical protein
MTKQANVAAAKALGAIAFARGAKCVPALCAGFMELIAGRDVGDKRTAVELKAWIAGWTEANLQAVAA